MALTVARCWIGEGISPRVQVPLLMWVYLVDAMLAPLGLLIAASAADQPGLLLLALPVLGMLGLFARERQQRLEQTLVLSSAYRGTALLLGEVIEADDRYTGIHSRQVVDLAIALADAVGLDGSQRRNVEFTALLHDVGKIHVPKEILNKPGPARRAGVEGHPPPHDRWRADAEAGRRLARERRRSSSARRTSATTATAIPTARRDGSRSRRASSRSATRTTR